MPIFTQVLELKFYFFFIRRQDINDSTKIRLILIRMSVIISEYINFFF